MKYHEPRRISLINSLLITAVYVLFFLLGAILISPDAIYQLTTLLFLIISAMMLFGFAFLIFRYTLEKFIYSKIRLIYKSIHSIKSGKEGRPHNKVDSQMLDEVTDDVNLWKEKQAKEVQQLKQLEAYRRDFIGNISHELKTPLFNIQGYILTLLDGGLEDPSINREYLKRTEKSVERLTRIIEDLDEISQLESGQLKLNIMKFDLVALAQDCIDMLEMKAKKRGISFVGNWSDKSIMVEGDREKLRQVFTNIMENAIRYGLEQGKIKISFFDMDENILTEITDDGIGIDPDELPRLFERFYRTSSGRASFAKGKGLGLSIVKHIIEGHNQTINVRSTKGVGTTFGFTLKKASV
jgi:two-component system, OmpR family, phosphate regulon sensor histidine kinase PhoR